MPREVADCSVTTRLPLPKNGAGEHPNPAVRVQRAAEQATSPVLASGRAGGRERRPGRPPDPLPRRHGGLGRWGAEQAQGDRERRARQRRGNLDTVNAPDGNDHSNRPAIPVRAADDDPTRQPYLHSADDEACCATDQDGHENAHQGTDPTGALPHACGNRYARRVLRQRRALLVRSQRQRQVVPVPRQQRLAVGAGLGQPEPSGLPGPGATPRLVAPGPGPEQRLPVERAECRLHDQHAAAGKKVAGAAKFSGAPLGERRRYRIGDEAGYRRRGAGISTLSRGRPAARDQHRTTTRARLLIPEGSGALDNTWRGEYRIYVLVGHGSR
jgi:hypothetical protein